jgi:polysaccharide export outer membrane protein
MMTTMINNHFKAVIFFLWIFSSVFGEDLYRLRIGDRLALAVYGEPSTRREVVLDTAGFFPFLNLDAVPALGKTIPEVKQYLTEHLKSYYRFPLILASPLRFTGGYTIIGEVYYPGRKPIIGNPTVLSALCEARGFPTRIFRNQTVDIVDFDRSFLSRNGKYVPIDFRNLVLNGDLSQDEPLQAEDYIFVASRNMDKVFVLGEVFRNIAINYMETKTLAEAIAEAGGLTLRASSRVMVIRGSLACPDWFYIDINRILKGYACDFPLETGDIVYVPAMRFTTLKEILQLGVQAFVGIVANVAGTNTFLEITPEAKNVNIITPVPTFSTGVSAGVTSSPPISP